MEDTSSRDSCQKDNPDGKKLLMMLRDSRESSLGGETNVQMQDVQGSYPMPS